MRAAWGRITVVTSRGKSCSQHMTMMMMMMVMMMMVTMMMKMMTVIYLSLITN